MDSSNANFEAGTNVVLENQKSEQVSMSDDAGINANLVKKVGHTMPKKPLMGPMETPELDIPLLILPQSCHSNVDEFDLEGNTNILKVEETNQLPVQSNNLSETPKAKSAAQRISTSKVPRFSIKKHLITSCNSKLDQPML